MLKIFSIKQQNKWGLNDKRFCCTAIYVVSADILRYHEKRKDILIRGKIMKQIQPIELLEIRYKLRKQIILQKDTN